MITIYHLGLSQSDRIVWLMEELGLPYRLEWFDRGPDRLAPPEYVALHPAAMAPVVKDGDRVLAESTAIVQYIAHKHGGGRLTVSASAENYFDYLYWLQFNNNAQSGLFVKMALTGIGQEQNLIGKVAQRRTEGLYKQMNDHLGNSSYLAGPDFTLADLMSGFAVTTLPALGGPLARGSTEYPTLRAAAETAARLAEGNGDRRSRGAAAAEVRAFAAIAK